MLSNKGPYDEKGANKYYIGYVGRIKDIKLHTHHMNVLANDNELLICIEIWDKIETLLNKRLHTRPVYNEYIKTKIN